VDFDGAIILLDSFEVFTRMKVRVTLKLIRELPLAFYATRGKVERIAK
jgi:hypothetical protein